MYIKLNNGVPEQYSIRQLRKDNPNVSFPKDPPVELLEDWNVYPYTVADKPSITEGQYLTEGQFQKVDGSWVRSWLINDYTAEELEAQKQSKRSDAEMSRYDFALAAANAGYITHAEASQWVVGNAIPQAVQGVLDGLPAEQVGVATMEVLARPTVRRDAPIMVGIAAAFNTDDSGLDALFGI